MTVAVDRLRARHPDRVPVVATFADEPETAYRLLLPRDMTAGQLLWFLRRKRHVGAEVALFLIIDGREMVTSGTLVASLDRGRGILEAKVVRENTFGGAA